MESFVLHEIELKAVETNSPLSRSLSLVDDYNLQFDQLDTKLGPICIYRQGCELNKFRPVLITYHDIGLNSISNFQAFFNYPDMKLMLQSISVIHLNAVGQEENSPTYPNIPFPSLDELAEQIKEVCDRFSIKNFIGFGVGAGANILSRFALKNPKYMDGLVLINPTASAASWTEWFYQKLNIYYLSSTVNTGLANFPESARDYLMWHHFGRQDETRNFDLFELYRNHFMGKSINAYNLSLFIDAFLKRTDLMIDRNNLNKNFECPILLICGALSPHIEDSVNMNSRINPANSTWMKIQNCGMVLEEQPGKVAEALKLFIQGLGYSMNAMSRAQRNQRAEYASNLGAHQYISDCEIMKENMQSVSLGDNGHISDGDKCLTHFDKIEYNPPQNRIIENPIPPQC